MISETTRSRNPAGHAGLLQNLLALTGALVDFFESRFALLAEESKAALVQLLVLASYLVLALILCAFGYVFLIASAVVGLAHLAGISWLWTALMAAGAHFIVALVLLLVARSRMTKPLFRATVSEIKKDREWLKNLDATDQPVSLRQRLPILVSVWHVICVVCSMNWIFRESSEDRFENKQFPGLQPPPPSAH